MTTVEETRQRIDQEIAEGRNDIRSDKLDISYGELANLYENQELIIRPEYQRLFRWTATQKTRFIESILRLNKVSLAIYMPVSLFRPHLMMCPHLPHNCDGIRFHHPQNQPTFSMA